MTDNPPESVEIEPGSVWRLKSAEIWEEYVVLAVLPTETVPKVEIRPLSRPYDPKSRFFMEKDGFLAYYRRVHGPVHIGDAK